MDKKPTYEELEHRVIELESNNETLRSSLERWKSLAKNAPDFVTIVDRDHIIEYINNPVPGLQSEEVIGQSVFEFIQPAYHDLAKETINSVFATGQPRSYESLATGPEGTLSHYENRLGPLVVGENVVAVSIFGNDITARKNAEALQAESERKFETLVGNLPGTAYQFVLSEKGEFRFDYMGENCIDLFGISADDIKADANLLFDLIPQPDAETVQKAIRKSVASLTPYDVEHRIIKKNGETVWIHATSTPRKQSNGNIVWDGIGLDITERKRAEEALHDAELNLKRTFGISPSIIAKANLNTGYFVEVSPLVTRILGFSDEEFTSKPIMEFIHPDDRQRTIDEISEQVKGKEVAFFENRYLCKDGSYKWMAWQGTPADKNGIVTAIGSDITSRKYAEDALRESENRLRATLDAAPFPTVIVDSNDDKVYFWSQGAISLFGHTASTASDWYQLAYPDPDYRRQVIERWKPFLDIARESGKPVNTGEYEVTCKDGSVRICEIYATFLPDNLIVTFNDITERKRVETELQERETKYRYLYETMAQGIVIQDNQGRILEANRAAQEILGLSMDQMLGRTPYDPRWKLIQEDGSPYNPDEVPSNIALRTGKPTKDVLCGIYVPEQEEYRWIIINSAPHFRDGERTPLFTMTVFTDITDRKLAEEELRKSESKYRQVFETNKAIKLMINPEDGAIVEANEAACNFYGYSRREMMAMKITDINALPPEKTHLEMQKARSEERLFFRFSHRLASGEVRDVEVYSGPVNLGETTILYSIIHDVTDRVKAEKALAKQKEFLQKAQEIGHIGTWELNIEKNELIWTDENYRIFGLPIGTKLTYETFLNCVHPDDREYVDQKWKAAFDKKPYDIEHRVLVDGDVKWVREKAELHFDETGKCIRGTGFTQDITDRKQAEEALRKSEERLRLSIDASGLSFWEWYPETGIIYFDEKWQQSLGYEPGEKVFDKEWWKTHIHPDSKPAFEKALKDYLDGENPRYDLEYQIKTKTGEWRWGRAVGECIEFDEDGQPKLLLGTHEDITATKTPEAQSARGEKELKWLFRSMINAFVLFDSVFDENGKFVSYRFVFINEAYERITGVKNEEVRGKTVHEVWPKTEPEWIKKYGEVAVTGVPQSFEMYHHPTKKLYYCNVYRPWDIPDRFCVIFDDITERKQIEEELHHARKMESIGVLAGGVAHDFNNILGIVLGNAELALDDVPEWNPARDFLKEIRSATLRAKDVVQELLRFSRKSTGQKKPLEIGQLVKESMKSLRATIPSSVDFSLNIPEDLHYIHADPTQIHQILMNLLSNASDAMEERGILKVTLENVVLEKKNAKVNLEPGKYVKLSMKDTGAGIETENLSRIFDPYFTTKEIGKGTGMGLAVIYGIVQQHAGSIQVETEIGKGTTFELYFPAIDSKPLMKEKSAGGISGGKERILFVDDEDAMVNLNRQRLERLGYGVTGFTDPLEALEFFSANPDQIDLLITDMTMPKMTGDRLTQEILKIRSDMPIILCTGYSSRISEDKAQELGIRKYIDKPIEMLNLARSVREVLDGK